MCSHIPFILTKPNIPNVLSLCSKTSTKCVHSFLLVNLEWMTIMVSLQWAEELRIGSYGSYSYNIQFRQSSWFLFVSWGVDSLKLQLLFLSKAETIKALRRWQLGAAADAAAIILCWVQTEQRVWGVDSWELRQLQQLLQFYTVQTELMVLTDRFLISKPAQYACSSPQACISYFLFCFLSLSGGIF